MKGIATMKPILPWWQISVLLAACGAGIYLLLPDDPELIENLLRDGQTREARRHFDRASPADRVRDASRYRLLELQLARRELPAHDPGALAAAWRLAVSAWRDSGYSEPVFNELRALIPRLTDAAAAWRVLAPELPRASGDQRTRIAADLTKAALAVSQPATAAEVFVLAHPTGDRSEADALELARLWRLAGQPESALAALASLATPAIATLRLELLRELGRNREALTSLREAIDARPAGVPTAEQVSEFGTVALQAGAPAEAVIVYQRFVTQHPTDLAAVRRLRDLLVASGDPGTAVAFARQAATLSQRDRRDVQELAQILEWSGAPAAAFDAWSELGRAGHLPAIDRLVALNPGLYRDNDLVAVLERVVPVGGRSDYTLRLARLEVTLGRYSQAREYFERYLQEDPQAADVMLELARLLVELNRFADAEAWFRRAGAARPADPAIRRQIAETLVLQGLHHDALAIYAELARQTPTEEVIEPYVRLAESLGRYGEMVRAIRLRIEQSPAPLARDYLMLAYGFEVTDDPAQRRVTLEEGLQRLPDNDELRLQLASAYATQKEFSRAQAIVADHSRLRVEPAAAEFYLEMMRLNGDLAAERRFLATPLADAVARDESVRERVARAREALGELPEAERLWRELLSERPGDPDRTSELARVLVRQGRGRETKALIEPLLRQPIAASWRLASDIAQAAGDARAAEKYQLAYLAAHRAASATDWSALGDIRLSRGDRTGAERAYTEALRRLHTQIAPKGLAP